MFNFKVYSKGDRRNWEAIINYDKHKKEYKDKEMIVVKDTLLNHTLINNTSIFKAEIKDWQRDQKDKNKAQFLYRRLTTDELMNKLDHTTIMRSIRYGINGIEITMLTKNCKTDEESREKIITFYQNVLDQSLAIFNKNLDPKNYVKVIKADIHFDQSVPHLHAHFSNWNLKFSELLHKEIRSSNIDKNDLIKILKRETQYQYHEFGNQIKINELYLEKMNKVHYKEIEFLDTTKRIGLYDNFRILLSDKYEDIYTKSLKELKNLKSLELMSNTKAMSLNKRHYMNDKLAYFERVEKMLYFIKIDTKNMNFIETNRAWNELLSYSFFMQVIQEAKKIDPSEKYIQKKLNDDLFVKNVLTNKNLYDPRVFLYRNNWTPADFEISKYIPQFIGIEKTIKEIYSIKHLPIKRTDKEHQEHQENFKRLLPEIFAFEKREDKELTELKEQIYSKTTIENAILNIEREKNKQEPINYGYQGRLFDRSLSEIKSINYPKEQKDFVLKELGDTDIYFDDTFAYKSVNKMFEEALNQSYENPTNMSKKQTTNDIHKIMRISQFTMEEPNVKNNQFIRNSTRRPRYQQKNNQNYYSDYDFNDNYKKNNSKNRFVEDNSTRIQKLAELKEMLINEQISLRKFKEIEYSITRS